MAQHEKLQYANSKFWRLLNFLFSVIFQAIIGSEPTGRAKKVIP